MARHHALSEEELALVRRRRGPASRLGFAVLLAFLKFPGRPLRPNERAPEKIVRYVVSQVGEDPRAMDAYAGGAGAEAGAVGKAGREGTRREHLSEISNALGFGPFDADARAAPLSWIGAVAAMTDSGAALVEALIEEMRRRRAVAPALYAVEELAWEARRDAREGAGARRRPFGGPARGARRPATYHAGPTRSPLVWLRQPPGAPSPDNFLKVVEKPGFVRSLGLSPEAAHLVHHNRLSRLAAEGARMTTQNLSTLGAGRRRATLVAYLLDRAASLTDEALEICTTAWWARRSRGPGRPGTRT